MQSRRKENERKKPPRLLLQLTAIWEKSQTHYGISYLKFQRSKNESKNREFDFNVFEYLAGTEHVSGAYSYGTAEKHGSGLAEGYSDACTGEYEYFGKEEEMKEEKVHFSDSELLDLLDDAVCTNALRSDPDLVVDPEKSGSKNYYTKDSERLDWLCTERGAEWFTAYLTYYSSTIDRNAIDTVMDEEK
jgi:hypothetical protein